ncbi:MAG: putative toxin-antitoxin system toxin component, PIN family [Alloprevotella sp.]
MQRIVLDTNCLLMSLPRISPYRIIWERFLAGDYVLCVSTEIIEEYSEIISNKTTSEIANNVITTILNAHNTELISPYYRFNMIQADKDDNKFVDCSIAANAKYIVTNDKHFDVLKHIAFPRVNVINAKSFVEELKKGE